MKIPTVIHYDEFGNVVAVGAEDPPLDDEDEGGFNTPPIKLEWYDLARKHKHITLICQPGSSFY